MSLLRTAPRTAPPPGTAPAAPPARPLARRVGLPAGGRPGRVARETLLAAAGSAALAVAMTWPALRDPARTVAQDLGDPLYFVWQLAWTGHALRTGPGDAWTTNAFSGAEGNLAYTDTMLGYAPVSALGQGLDGALVTYNVLFAGIAAMAFLGAYLLARVLGARWPGAVVAAGTFAYAPWRLAHDRHLNVLSTGGIALALALIAYGHGWSLRADRRPATAARPWIALAGWLVACWQLTLGFAVGIPFAWALLTVLGVAVAGWALTRRTVRSRALLAANAAGGLAFAVTGLLLTGPYTRVVEQFPIARRTEEMLGRYSPSWQGLLTAPPESTWWGGLTAGWRDGMAAPQEQALLPGVVVVLLAAAGVGYTAWSWRHRLLLLAGALGTAVLALGVHGPGGGRWTYLPLFENLPGFEALRTPGRLVLWTTLCLGLLAAGTLTRLAEDPRVRPAGRPRRRAAAVTVLLLLPGALVVAEGAGRVAHPVVPRPPVALDRLAAPLLVLPTSQGGDFTVMTWSTQGFPAMANGGSGFEPPTQSTLRRDVRGFPDAHSVAVLRRDGVRTVVLDTEPGRLAGTAWERAAERPVDGLGLTVRRSGRAVIYDL